MARVAAAIPGGVDSGRRIAGAAGFAASQICVGPGYQGCLGKRSWRSEQTGRMDRQLSSMESKSRQAVVLLSGGMDSCVTAAIARERHGAGNVAALHAGYGQRTQGRERRAFEEIADFYKIRERLVVQLEHFRAIGGSALTDKKIAVPEGELGAPAPDGNIPVTYV